jgi:hypothetical protein
LNPITSPITFPHLHGFSLRSSMFSVFVIVLPLVSWRFCEQASPNPQWSRFRDIALPSEPVVWTARPYQWVSWYKQVCKGCCSIPPRRIQTFSKLRCPRATLLGL